MSGTGMRALYPLEQSKATLERLSSLSLLEILQAEDSTHTDTGRPLLPSIILYLSFMRKKENQ